MKSRLRCIIRAADYFSILLQCYCILYIENSRLFSSHFPREVVNALPYDAPIYFYQIYSGGRQGLGCRLGRCFCFAEVSTGHPHPSPTDTIYLCGFDIRYICVADTETLPKVTLHTQSVLHAVRRFTGRSPASFRRSRMPSPPSRAGLIV